MKTTLILLLAAFCAFATSCSKKPKTMVSTKIVYSHPDGVHKGFTITRNQELGTISRKTPSPGQPLTLIDKKVVSFNQSTDASNPSKIRVMVESEMDGFPPEEQVLEFSSSAPNPPAAKFKNGLSAFVTVNTYPFTK